MNNARQAILLGSQGAANIAGGLLQMFGYKDPIQKAQLEAQDNASKFYEASMSNDPNMQREAWRYKFNAIKALTPYWNQPGVANFAGNLLGMMNSGSKEFTDFIAADLGLQRAGYETANNISQGEEGQWPLRQIFGNRTLYARPVPEPTTEELVQYSQKSGLPAFGTPQAEEDFRFNAEKNKALYGGLRNTPLQPPGLIFGDGSIDNLQAFPERREIKPLGGREALSRQLQADANYYKAQAEKIKNPQMQKFYIDKANDILNKLYAKETMYGGDMGLGLFSSSGGGGSPKSPGDLLGQYGYESTFSPGPSMSIGPGGMRVSQNPAQPNPEHIDKRNAWSLIRKGGFDPQSKSYYPIPSSVQDNAAFMYGLPKIDTDTETKAVSGFLNSLGILKIVEDNIKEQSDGYIEVDGKQIPNYSRGLGWNGLRNNLRNSFNKFGFISKLFGESDPNFIENKSLYDLFNDNAARVRTGATASAAEFEKLQNALLGALESGGAAEIWTRLQHTKREIARMTGNYFKGIQDSKYLPAEYRAVGALLGVRDNYATSEYDNVDPKKAASLLSDSSPTLPPTSPYGEKRELYFKTLQEVRNEEEWKNKSPVEQRMEAMRRVENANGQ